MEAEAEADVEGVEVEPEPPEWGAEMGSAKYESDEAVTDGGVTGLSCR